MSETWLTVPISELVNITGYNFVSNDRKSKIGRGVGIYLQSIECKILKECNFFFLLRGNWVNIFVQIIVPQGKNISGIFLDLYKAFDTLDHEILFTKQEDYGIRNAALQWINKTTFLIAINLFNSAKLVHQCRP